MKNVREKKAELIDNVRKLIKKLENISLELPEKMNMPLPILPIIDEDLEYPEKNLEVIDNYQKLE